MSLAFLPWWCVRRRQFWTPTNAVGCRSHVISPSDEMMYRAFWGHEECGYRDLTGRVYPQGYLRYYEKDFDG